MKYEWIETEAYSNGKNLVEYVKKVLKEFGTKYTINFAEVLINWSLSLLSRLTGRMRRTAA